jgi:O-antigen/teichoic acid export membrane protein
VKIQKIFRLSITLFVFAIGLGFTFVMQVLLARTLSVFDYGVFATVYSIAAILSSLGTMGFDVSLLRFIPILSDADRGYFFRIAVKSTLLFTSILALCSAIVAELFLNQNSSTIVLTSLIVFGWAIVRLLSAFARSLDRYNLSIVIDRYCREGALVCVAVAALLFGRKLTLDLALLVAFVGCLVGGLLAAPLLRSISMPLLNAEHRNQRVWRAASIGLLLVNVLELTISRIEIILASVLMSAEIAAFTNAFVLIGNAISIPTVASTVMVMPIVSKQYGLADRGSLFKTLTAFTGFSFIGGAVVGFVVLNYSSFVVGMFGPEISDRMTPNLLKIVILTKVVGLVSIAATPLILMSGKVRGLIIAYCITLCAKIGASFILVPMYGLAGVIYVLASSSAMMAALQAGLMWQILRTFRDRDKNQVAGYGQ